MQECWNFWAVAERLWSSRASFLSGQSDSHCVFYEVLCSPLAAAITQKIPKKKKKERKKRTEQKLESVNACDIESSNSNGTSNRGWKLRLESERTMMAVTECWIIRETPTGETRWIPGLQVTAQLCSRAVRRWRWMWLFRTKSPPELEWTPLLGLIEFGLVGWATPLVTLQTSCTIGPYLIPFSF